MRLSDLVITCLILAGVVTMGRLFTHSQEEDRNKRYGRMEN